MYEAVLESALEIVPMVLYSVLASVLTATGLLAEEMGLTQLLAGDTVGLWFLYVGTLFVVAGILIVRNRLLPVWRERRTATRSGS